MLDANEDVHSHYIQSLFDLVNMKEAILHQHGNLAPATFESGVESIDSIFTTPTIQPVLSG
jgi:hypothetical protein